MQDDRGISEKSRVFSFLQLFPQWGAPVLEEMTRLTSDWHLRKQFKAHVMLNYRVHKITVSASETEACEHNEWISKKKPEE